DAAPPNLPLLQYILCPSLRLRRSKSWSGCDVVTRMLSGNACTLAFFMACAFASVSVAGKRTEVVRIEASGGEIGDAMLDEATLRRLYLEEQRSIRDIAALKRIPSRTVYDLLI